MSHRVGIIENTRDREPMEIGKKCLDVKKNMAKSKTQRTNKQMQLSSQ